VGKKKARLKKVKSTQKIENNKQQNRYSKPKKTPSTSIDLTLKSIQITQINKKEIKRVYTFNKPKAKKRIT